ncbi:hypothetical protein TREMEDRAFT_73934 [Tremella mesenterica DSM 1558]|uniref:uncharacterized protein n=1 Tax=Tremella mesenterica (strain ATCC 24925 / CBS 8224 / DSM 1558 / NBRC 9311 / NRRL Y-6157 / RJB 2259-6 / UBC 559-6) TaxID=578456 RepID=UPI0003F4A324|nr:uncharacterized protein TREMEDRAFT_73934 [Tremella mesenterica DSM 1558]EIW69657.1 hypothetical protein TREMEDRAFT_73934 [Tremella mesenterica DSM 1558]
MSAKAKVGSWLNTASSDLAEPYESSDAESSTSVLTRNEIAAQNPIEDEEEDEDVPEADDVGREEEVDWESVLPQIRGALLDKSQKRRKTFLSRYLYITATSPPIEQTPLIVGRILQTLSALTTWDQLDDVVPFLMELIKRDETTGSALKLGDKVAKSIMVGAEKCLSSAKRRKPKNLLDAFEASMDKLGATKAVRLRHKVGIRIWRVLREFRDGLPSILKLLLTRTITNPVKLSVLIGHIIGVALRLRAPSKAKEVKVRDGREAVQHQKDANLTFYSTHVLGAKSALHNYVLEFLREFVTSDDLITKLLPNAERMLLRSPEIALPLTTHLVSSSPHDISSILPGKLTAAALSASKSSNVETRAKAVAFMAALCDRCQSHEVLAKVTTEILALPKSGKTASAEHRLCLFDMVTILPPSDQTSAIVFETLSPLISKESNEAALHALCTAIIPHLSYSLTSSTTISPASTSTLVKEFSSIKLASRRGVAHAVGSAIWKVHERGGQFSSEGWKFIHSITPALATSLASATSNQPAVVGGFLEGFVVVALTLGPLANVTECAQLFTSPHMTMILSTGAKPSFLLNDKVRARLPAAEDELWLLRSLEMVPTTLSDKLNTHTIRVALGNAFIHLAFDSKHSEIRRSTLQAICKLSGSQPKTISWLIRDALTVWFEAEVSHQNLPFIGDDEGGIRSKSRDVGRLLQAALHEAFTAPQVAREEIAIDFLILSHHPGIDEDAQISWITLVQSLRLDPTTVAMDMSEKILKHIWEAAAVPPRDPNMAQAAYRALTTLCFLCPSIYVNATLSQVRSDLDPSSLDFIGEEERGIWSTPSDHLYVDVLSHNKDLPENKNSRDYATKKWEQEVRASLSQKKSNGPALTKEQKALVETEQAREAEVRERIRITQARLARGIQLIQSLIASNSEVVMKHVGEMAQAMLKSVFASGEFLVEDEAFKVFIQFATLASQRLGEYRRLLLAAILRSYNSRSVPEDYLDEPIGELVTRLLHQLQFVADQTPLDNTSFSLVSLLLARVVSLGGIGTPSAQSDEAQEQLTLVVNIIAACCGEFADDAFPRLDTIQMLIDIIGTHSRLAKDASSALVDLGAAIKDVATLEESNRLIAGTLSKDANVRNAVLQALQPVDLTDMDYSQELWIAVHDADDQNSSLARHLWEDNGLDVPETYLSSLLTYLTHDTNAVRISTASALATAAQQFPSQVLPTLDGLQALYADKARELQPEFDRFGMVIPETLNRPDPFESRIAVALALEKLSPLFPADAVVSMFEFMIARQALGDRNGQVRRAMLAASTALVDFHGGEHVADLMKMFEGTLGGQSGSSETEDYIKEAVVILFGRLARHLDPQDSRIPQVVDRLVEALNTPSELVQSAVADCLPPLVQTMGDEAEYLVDKLFSTLTTGSKYASRRGAAYGLAGVVKGRGLTMIKEYELMDKLKEAAEDKGSYQARQGALFAFETLSATLGKAFEPYILSIVPLLLALFGDTNADVREATQDAAKIIMSRISGHCVKLMLPTLLNGLEEKQWRIKKGSIELLGSMAFCAPKQLSLSLPTIIPHLTGVINDSHAQVKAAANTSLKRFGEVLNNPEVKAIQNTLMKALADPTANITKALSALLKTSFEHYLDAPSLALVMPIIDRGLRQRSSEIKRRAVQIVGNMASLTESRDLVPYLNELMPLVHEVLVDPVPEARATAAKSLGTLVERLGEQNFPELVNQLLHTLKSDTSGVDRQGAAQGLSEVLSGLGMDRMEGLLPDVIANTASPRAYVREGFISLLVYLPTTFGHRFSPHLGRIIPPILNGLADDSEFVREASMRAGKMIIANYSSKAVDLLLPELERGMLDGSWRIRQSSISLTGELLYRVTGISGKVELEDEEVPAHNADNARKALLAALGPERRDRVLATLYIVRQDNVSTVRQASVHIWKALVQNTPRTTREILPVLMQLIMGLLGDLHIEQQETASRTLGELCRKNGERIFSEIIPILQKAITASDAATKEGACLAFADVMAASNKEILGDYGDAIISSVRTALVDPEASVRSAAAKTFDAMQHFLGTKAVDQTIPTLLEAMRNPGESSETALQALKEVMSVRANSVFPILIPTLVAQPITAFNARALGSLVKVAGTALNRRLDTVLGALIKSLENEKSEDVKSELQAAIESLLSSVTDTDGVHVLELLLMEWAKDPRSTIRASACHAFGTFCQVNTADTSDYRVDWIRILISMFADPAEKVVNAAWQALDNFVKTIPQDDLKDLVVVLRRSIESTAISGVDVAGFSRPKGVQSIVPILLAGVLSGTQEQREQAALGIGELVQRTTESAIKPYIIQLTGPLIRVISGAGIAPQIKSAILLALTVLLEEVPQLVRPFHPQLTRTFVKSASDPAAASVRTRAAAGLGELMKHQTRVDPLITELIGGIKSSEKDIAPSMVQALAAVCNSAGKNIGPAARTAIIDLVEEAFMEGRHENYNQAIGKVIAGLAKNDPDSIRSIVDTFLAAPTPPTALVSISILSVLETCPEAFYELEVVGDIARKVSASVAVEGSAIARPAREARELMRSLTRYKEDGQVQGLIR